MPTQPIDATHAVLTLQDQLKMLTKDEQQPPSTVFNSGARYRMRF